MDNKSAAMLLTVFFFFGSVQYSINFTCCFILYLRAFQVVCLSAIVRLPANVVHHLFTIDYLSDYLSSSRRMAFQLVS